LFDRLLVLTTKSCLFRKRAGIGNLFRYQGEFQRDRATGQGQLLYANGNVYNGQWQKDLRHGEGVMECKEDGSRYEGYWENDRRHGLGRVIFRDGSTLTGTWRDGYLPRDNCSFTFGHDVLWANPDS